LLDCVLVYTLLSLEGCLTSAELVDSLAGFPFLSFPCHSFFHFSRGTLLVWNIPPWSSKKVEDSNSHGTYITYHNQYITMPAHSHRAIPYRGTRARNFESTWVCACVHFSPSFSLPLSPLSTWDIPPSCLYCTSAD